MTNRAARRRLTVTISWPELSYMPDSITSSEQSELGYQSVIELQSTLKKRWHHKSVTNIPNGVCYSEQFNAFGESGLRMFKVTLP